MHFSPNMSDASCVMHAGHIEANTILFAANELGYHHLLTPFSFFPHPLNFEARGKDKAVADTSFVDTTAKGLSCIRIAHHLPHQGLDWDN